MSKEATIWIVIAIYAIFMVVIGVVNSKNSGGMEGKAAVDFNTHI